MAGGGCMNDGLLGNDLLSGKLVRLEAMQAEVFAEHALRWGRDSEYRRLLDSQPPRLWSQKGTQEWMKKSMEKGLPDYLGFLIRTLEDERAVGDIGLDGIRWEHGDAYVGIGLGDRADWGKGFGTDAMRILARFAFNELNLHRLTLDVFEYNPRAIRSYEKVGFVREGAHREALLREGRYWDLIYMGLLREDWEKIAS
jgi:RimJ/RimL family protein N-acetyltransferase